MTAIAAAVGCEFVLPKLDYDSLDGLVISSAGSRPLIAVQLKATAQRCIANGHLTLPLSIKNYDDLRSAMRCAPIMLVVLHLPESTEEWMTHDVDALLLRNNAYYYNLLGMNAVPNTATVNIKIPIDQRLTAQSLQQLLDHVAVHRVLPK